MKQMGTLAAALALVILALAAPVRAGDGEQADGPTTIRGCLADGAADGWYVLTKKKGDETKEIQVEGDDSFEAHVGHEVELTGTWEEGESGKYFAATAMKHIAATCP
jgi:hypothetical protein